MNLEIEHLISRLTHDDLDERKGVLEELVKLGAPAVEPLCQALEHKNWFVRLQATKALKKIGDARAVHPLCRALSDPMPEVRSSAEEALLNIYDENAIEPLCGALQNPQLPVRLAAASALTQIGAPAVEPMCALLQHPEMEVRMLASGVLLRLGSATVEPLVKVLGDRNDATDSNLVEALLKHDNDASLLLLRRLLGHSDWYIRSKMSAELTAQGVSASKPLRQMMNDSGHLLSQDIVATLIQIGAPAVEMLCAALEDSHPPVRMQAVNALGGIGDPRAVVPLAKTLNTDNLEMRLLAVKALGKLGAPAVDPLCAALKNPASNFARLPSNRSHVSARPPALHCSTRCAILNGTCGKEPRRRLAPSVMQKR